MRRPIICFPLFKNSKIYINIYAGWIILPAMYLYEPHWMFHQILLNIHEYVQQPRMLHSYLDFQILRKEEGKQIYDEKQKRWYKRSKSIIFILFTGTRNRSDGILAKDNLMIAKLYSNDVRAFSGGHGPTKHPFFSFIMSHNQKHDKWKLN